MKVVLDTNVLVSGMLSAEGPCGQILDLVADGELWPCVDGRILGEYGSVLRRPKLKIPQEDAGQILELLRFVAESVTALPLGASLPDPGDLAFLEVAASAGAVLITGNKRHYPASARKGVVVVAPREFLDLMRYRSDE